MRERERERLQKRWWRAEWGVCTSRGTEQERVGSPPGKRNDGVSSGEPVHSDSGEWRSCVSEHKNSLSNLFGFLLLLLNLRNCGVQLGFCLFLFYNILLNPGFLLPATKGYNRTRKDLGFVYVLKIILGK